MAMGSWRTVLLLLVGGCGQVFGLDSPTLMPDAPVVSGQDSDRDGFDDAVDNCPLVANPDQLDTDKNLVGDVCEGCVTLPIRATDDDDGDMVFDLADTCIGHAGMETDSDGDGIGDTCDPRVGPDARFCVWTFRTPGTGENPNVWTSSWQVSGAFEIKDSMITDSSSMQLDVATLRTAGFASTTGIAFDTRLLLRSYTVPMVVGMGFELQGSVSTLYTCQVVQGTMSTGLLQILKDGQAVDSMLLPVAIPMNTDAYGLVSVINGDGMLQIRCSFESDVYPSPLVLTRTEPTQAVKLLPRLIASHASVDFYHVTLYKLGI